MDNFNIHKFFKSEYLSEDRKAKEYIKSIEDKDEREAEKERMFGDDEKPSKFKKSGEKAGFDMRGLKEVIKKTIKEYTSEYDPATAKRNFFAASYNRPGDTERFRNYMEFLSKLRTSGKTNMLGAAPYLQAEFNLEKKEAKDLLAYWMGSYRNPDLDEAKAIGLSPGKMEMGDDGKMSNVKASNSERKMAMRSVIDILKAELDVSNDDALGYIRTHRDDLFDGTVDAFSKDEIVDDYNEYMSVNMDIN